jgi:hypothetical protein
VSIPVLLLLASMLLRRGLPQSDIGAYGFSLDAGAVGAAFLKQFSAALPCSYSLLFGALLENLFSRQTFTASAHRVVLLGGFLFSWCLITNLVRQAREGGLAWRRWASLGLLLALLPVPAMCAIHRYHAVLRWGYGYLPVYLQYFGVALLLAASIAALATRLRGSRWAAGVLALGPAVLCSGIAVLHYAANRQVVAGLRVPCLHPRQEIEEILEAGLLSQARPGSVLVIDPFDWDTDNGGTYFYCYHCATRFKRVLAPCWNKKALRKALPARPGEGGAEALVRVRYHRAGLPGGFIVTGKLRAGRLGAGGLLRESAVSGMRLAVWREGEPGTRDRPFVFHGCCWLDSGGTHWPFRVDLPSEQLNKVGQTAHWTLYEVSTAFPHLDAEAVWLELRSPGDRDRLGLPKRDESGRRLVQ